MINDEYFLHTQNKNLALRPQLFTPVTFFLDETGTRQKGCRKPLLTGGIAEDFTF
jgi:hypothetical protein